MQGEQKRKRPPRRFAPPTGDAKISVYSIVGVPSVSFTSSVQQIS
jgi:hypothetical protein